MPLILPQPITPILTASTPIAKPSLSKGIRLQVIFPDAFSGSPPSKPHDPAKRRITGVYDSCAVQAVFAVLALPIAALDGFDEAPYDGEVSFAGLYLGRYDGGDAGTVGKDSD